MHPDFWKLCELLQTNGIEFGILGNPYHLDDDVCKRLASLGCKKYQLSLDGLRETHDRFRKPGSFDITLEKIETIRKSGMYCAVMTTVSKANLSEIPELLDIIVEHQADVFAFGRYCPTSAEKSETYHIEPAQYRAFLDVMWKRFEFHKDCHTTFNLKDHLWTLYLYEQGVFTIPGDLDDNVIYDGCHVGDCHMTILPTGEVYACRRMESKIGDLSESSLCDLFLGRKLDEYRQYKQFAKCAKCELLRFCRGCPAVSRGYTGNPYAPDPQCWKEIEK